MATRTKNVGLLNAKLYGMQGYWVLFCSFIHPLYRAPYLKKAEGFFESSISLELYCLFSLSQKYQKSWIALQRARADPRDPYNPPLMWGRWSPWKGYPVFVLRRWEDISKFSFLGPQNRK